MPGQRRGREREAGRRRARERRERGGRWVVLFETGDHQEFRAYLKGAQVARFPADDVRLDTLCGREPTSVRYRVSVLVPRGGG